MTDLIGAPPPATPASTAGRPFSMCWALHPAGEITPLLAALNLLGGAALEWGRVLAYSRHAAEAMAVAAIMAAAGSFYLTSHARPPNSPASARSVSAPVAIRPGGGCFIQAEPAGLVATLPQIKIEIKAAAQPGQVAWVLVPVTARVPGKLGTGTRPLPVVLLPYVGNALASPRPSPAGQCVMVLSPPPAGWIATPALEWIWQPAS